MQSTKIVSRREGEGISKLGRDGMREGEEEERNLRQNKTTCLNKNVSHPIYSLLPFREQNQNKKY